MGCQKFRKIADVVYGWSHTCFRPHTPHNHTEAFQLNTKVKGHAQSLEARPNHCGWRIMLGLRHVNLKPRRLNTSAKYFQIIFNFLCK